MPGPSPRSGFTARIGSSARRGANVPAGVPGVYRVPRRRVVTVQGDTGAAGVVDPNPWIQPADMQAFVAYFRIGYHDHLDHATDGEFIFDNNGLPVTDYSAICRLIQTDSANFHYEASVSFFPIYAASLDPFVPSMGDWPPGATGVEQEAPEGVRTADPIRLIGTMFQVVQRQSATEHEVFGQELRRYLEAGYTMTGSTPNIPGTGSGTDPDTVSLYGGSVLESWPPISVPPTTPPFPYTNTVTTAYDIEVGDEDSTGWLAVLLRSTTTFAPASAAISAVNWIESASLSNDNTETPYAAVTYTPPRYRFTF